MFTDNHCNLQRISIHALRVEGDGARLSERR